MNRIEKNLSEERVLSHFKLMEKLSNNQQSCSDKVKEALIQKKNVLIHAVTGAGKTELVFASMEMYLKKRKRKKNKNAISQIHHLIIHTVITTVNLEL